MVKNNIEEIQELIQQIKNEYEEGVDFKFCSPNLIKKAAGGFHIQILSPSLKKYCRERFSLPLSDNGYIFDYEKGDDESNDLYYRMGKRSGGCDNDVLDCAGQELYRHNDNKQEPKTCKYCGKLTSYKEGQINEWSGKDMVGKSGKIINNYFHPECAKKYFADKEQPNENNTRIKEKLLRNLDKLCFDPNGYLANNEYLKTGGAEEEYHKFFNSGEKDWKNRYLKIVIEGEEIDLEDWDNTCPEYYEVKRALIEKIKSEIKQNPSEWKIEKGKEENYAVESNNRLIKHVSGQRHWKFAISYLWGGKSDERIKHWTEIETLINGSSLPVPNNKNKDKLISDTEKEQIRQYFLDNDIKEIRFEEGKLIVTHNNNNNNETKDRKEIFHDSELLKLMDYCQNSKGGKITKQSLGLNDKNTTNSNPNQGNYQLIIGLSLGAGAVILVGLIVFFVFRKRKNK